jgi:hypothetical protein
MAELELDDVYRDTLAGELDRVRVSQLMGGKAAADTGLGGTPFEAHSGCRAHAATGRAVEDAEQWPDRQLHALLEPAGKVLESPFVHPDLAALVVLAVPDQQRSPSQVNLALAERERFGDPQSGALQDGDDCPDTKAVAALAGLAHDRDGLLDARWIGGGTSCSCCAVTFRSDIPAASPAIAVGQRRR